MTKLSKEYLEMRDFNETYSDMPDGAFMALAEDMHGWDTDDWVWFAEKQEEDEFYN